MTDECSRPRTLEGNHIDAFVCDDCDGIHIVVTGPGMSFDVSFDVSEGPQFARQLAADLCNVADEAEARNEPPRPSFMPRVINGDGPGPHDAATPL
jgi:hypothetical protein